ncbi:hypothetical protein Ais01nite_02730 [Asanoa ishikariensis]|uniref:Uncharacterized protein n=1 Tax=Asanoa ishikariensis TaxID=137265 RepID=A0A1H3TM75_9ACTN|nr:hypothetical protein [Asanoa ishikariensis]GIF62238.1 hypothetical protein Ais01nite_02730 [Asanoa ishikariensis]SDZ50755.1 hypothetical protein SAMN05421684_5959 [Asanoa ishikariensis]
MRVLRLLTARLLATTAVATVALVGVTAGPAQAVRSQNIPVYSANNPAITLGSGRWLSERGAYSNGEISVEDRFDDGANGIILELSKRTGSAWSRVNLVSVRGVNKSNYVDVKPIYNGGPTVGQQLQIKVCKLLPNGDWKDCQIRIDHNYP